MAITDDLMKYVSERVLIDEETGCWLWTGAATRIGRPIFRFKGKATLVYRAIWEFLHECELTTDDHVCHKCDNGLCCNPDHLFLGNNVANMQDMVQKKRNFAAVDPERHAAAVRKGVQTRRDFPERNATGLKNGWHTKPESRMVGDRHWTKTNPELIRKGSRVHNARFSPEQIQSIRSDTRTLKQIAVDYGCHFSTISLIKRRQHYAEE